MNPIAGAFAVHGFVVRELGFVNAFPVQSFSSNRVPEMAQFCEGKIGGPWTPYEEEDAEAGRNVIFSDFFSVGVFWMSVFCRFARAWRRLSNV